MPTRQSLNLLKIKYILPLGVKSTGCLLVVFVLMLVGIGRAQGSQYEYEDVWLS
ncbi:MAG: hypothetical protein ACUZ8N_07955 [Candidatus Scalindua sp.]